MSKFDTPSASSVATAFVALALAISTAVVPMGAALASSTTQQGSYDVRVEFANQPVTGDNQTMSVVVDNTGNSEAVFNPVVEVPLTPSFTASPGATDTVTVVFPDGSVDSRTAEVQNSSYRDGKALFVFGEEVPADSVRTYRFNLTLNNSAPTTVESEVRPLYNEDVSVRNSTQRNVAGFGSLQAEVVDSSGSTVSDADIVVDGNAQATGSLNTDIIEGPHTVTAADADSGTVPFPTLERTVTSGESTTVTFVQRSDLSTPGVLARTAAAEVLAPSVGEVTTPATATRRGAVNVSFIVDTSSGTTVVGAAKPSSLGPIDQSELSTTADTATLNSSLNESVRVRLQATSDTEVAVKFTGFKLGDRTRDDQVTAADASAVAQQVVANGDTTQVSDVNDDGEVTAVDAMLIAQYDADNRDAEYERGDSS